MPTIEIPDDPRIERAIEHVRENIDRQIPLSELAGAACMSTSHFSRRFKRKVGLTPKEYVTKSRMEKARYLLVTGTLSIAAIAFVCGYATQAHFTTRFKAAYGKTPARYAQSVTKTESI